MTYPINSSNPNSPRTPLAPTQQDQGTSISPFLSRIASVAQVLMQTPPSAHKDQHDQATQLYTPDRMGSIPPHPTICDPPLLRSPNVMHSARKLEALNENARQQHQAKPKAPPQPFTMSSRVLKELNGVKGKQIHTVDLTEHTSEDIEAIRSRAVPYDSDQGTFTVNGRTYGVHGDDGSTHRPTLYPKEGENIATLGGHRFAYLCREYFQQKSPPQSPSLREHIISQLSPKS